MPTIQELNQIASQLLDDYMGLDVRGSGWSGDPLFGIMYDRPELGAAVPGTTIPPPSNTGACCSPGGHPFGFCEITTAEACAAVHGTFQGVGTVCMPNPCSGACCEFDPVGSGAPCVDTVDFLCTTNPNNVWHGYGTACATTRCEGSCCQACPEF